MPESEKARVVEVLTAAAADHEEKASILREVARRVENGRMGVEDVQATARTELERRGMANARQG